MKNPLSSLLLAAVLLGVTAVMCVAGLAGYDLERGQTSKQTAAQAKRAELRVSNAPIPTRVLVQSPTETDTDLQIICLFQSAPQNTLHGSLAEANEKLKGLIEKIRKPDMFAGELGETILLVPPAGTLAARKLLIIGLGDSENFTLPRMELVGTIAYRESSRLGVAHPFFAPTILDGGVTKFGTGEVAERFYTGFLRAARTERLLKDAGALPRGGLQDLTFLAGPTHAIDTQQGLERAVANQPHGSQ
jgi:hypothetical protein